MVRKTFHIDQNPTSSTTTCFSHPIKPILITADEGNLLFKRKYFLPDLQAGVYFPKDDSLQEKLE